LDPTVSNFSQAYAEPSWIFPHSKDFPAPLTRKSLSISVTQIAEQQH